MRILLVDDDPIFLEITSRILGKAGHVVSTAGDGAEALTAVRKAAGTADAFQLVLTDWEMPVMNGPDLCKAVRAEFGRDDVYLILLTGLGNAARFDGLYAGADDFICKPFEVSELHGSIRAAELVLAPKAAAQRRRAV